jgi:hypothetical protein
MNCCIVLQNWLQVCLKMLPEVSLNTSYIFNYENILATRIQSGFVHDTAISENENVS